MSKKYTMIVGSLTLRLLLRESRSLKDKRQVVRGIRDRLRQEFNVSVAEVAARDNRQTAELGVAMVSDETHAIKKTFGAIVQALRSHPVAELIDEHTDFW